MANLTNLIPSIRTLEPSELQAFILTLRERRRKRAEKPKRTQKKQPKSELEALSPQELKRLAERLGVLDD